MTLLQKQLNGCLDPHLGSTKLGPISVTINATVWPSAPRTTATCRNNVTERNQDAINLFLFALKPSFQLFEGQPGERDLIQSFLLKAAETYDKDLGLNHWKSAVVRSLASNDEFLDNPWAYLAKPPPAMAAG